MVAPPFPTSEGSKDAFGYASESQAARSSTKRSLRSKYYKENASAVKRVDDPIPPPSWMVEDEVYTAHITTMPAPDFRAVYKIVFDTLIESIRIIVGISISRYQCVRARYVRRQPPTRPDSLHT